MWTKTENSNATIPAALEMSGNMVIVRRRFKRIDATAEMPEHYEYEEWQMTADQYAVYQAMTEQMQTQEDAIVELAELISGVM